ncbi:uncharacterized protein [Dermacentor andersoni]|uniref:uncharacterized protein isoform X2 n=1 Tax=Dermacentor andersoni TaxID=34620 RepID=UPI0021553BF7|nr:uncharacterized protein LOC126534280 isoform X2 [Dermacentor andersoni]
MDAVGRAQGCLTCGIGTFKNKQEQFQHSFSLEHHTRVDEQSQSTWCHICNLCKKKAGPLQNFAAHLCGRKHRRAVEMYKETLAREEASRAKPKPSLRQSERAKGVSKANKKTPLSKGKQVKKLTKSGATAKKSTKQVLENCDRKTRYGNQGSQRSKDTNSQDYKDTQQKEPSRRVSWPSAGSRAKPSKRASVQRDSSEPTLCRRSRDDARNPSSKDSSFEGDSSPVEKPGNDGDYEMNRNWNGPPRFPMGPYGRGGAPFMGYGGRGNPPPWSRPPPPPRHPFNRYDGPRPFNRYNHHPPAEGPSPWSNDDYGYGSGSYGNGGWQGGSKHRNWDAHENDTRQGSDNASRDGSHRARHHSPENAPKTGSHSEHTATGANKEQGEKSAGRSSSSSGISGSSKLHGLGSNGKSPVAAKSSTPANTSEHSSNKVSSLPAKPSKSASGGAAGATLAKDPPARKGEGSAKSDSLSRQPQKKDLEAQNPSKPVSKIVKKPLLQAPTIKCTSRKANATSSPRLSPRSKPADGSKSMAGPIKTGASSSALATKVVGKPKPTTRSSTSPSPVATEIKIKVKQEASESTGGATETTTAALSFSSNRNHLIFLSSEEEDADAPGEKVTSKKKPRPDGDTSTGEKMVPRAKHSTPAAVSMPPPSPERGEPQVKKVVLRSPKLGPLSNRDIYRRDVLDKLVNFPSSPQVQAQLNKWMMEMQKSQRSVTSRKTMRLCATQARLGQEDDALLGSIPNIDFDVLVRQVESCELPEEMLKSLMQALNTDAEQPHSTAAEPPSSITASLSSKASSLRLTPELRASPQSTPPLGSAAAKSAATKASPASMKISSAAESPGGKSASRVSIKLEAATSLADAGTSSSEDECIVVPSPKKNVVPVLIDSDENGSTDEEDNRPSTTTPTVKALSGKATPERCAQSSSPLAQEGGHRVRKIQKHARRKGRQPSESVDGILADSAAALSRLLPDESGSSNVRVAELSQESKRPSPTLKSAIPTTAALYAGSTATVSSSVASSSHGRCSAQMSVSPPTFPEAPLEQLAAGHSPLANIATSPPLPSVATVPKVEPPPTPPPPATPPEDATPLDAIPPGAMPPGAFPLGAFPLGAFLPGTCPPGAMPSGTTPPLPVAVKSLVGDLTLRCQQEDAIRQELARIEEGIVSALATLEQLRKRKEELLGREAQVRKERLEILQCLQGAASALPGDNPPLLHFTLPAQSPTAVEMLSSFGTSGTDVMFGASQVPPGGASPVTVGQAGGSFPLASAPTAREMAQLLLPHLQQFGADIDINNLATSIASGGSSMPTMSPEVSGGPSSRRPTTKRRTAKDGEPTTTRKKARTAKQDADGEIEESQLDQIPPCQEISAHDSPIVALKLLGHYVYSCSNDCSARRHNLLDSSQCVKYLGSSKTVNAIEVHNAKSVSAVVYTGSLDGILRSYDPETGEYLSSFNAEAPIICTTLAWGKIYLGLQTGHVAVFNLKSQKFQDNFYCSNASVSRITTSTEGAQKLLCTITFDGSITVRDPSTGLLFRCFEGCVQPPCYIAINNGTVYTSSTDRTIRIHELRTGCLQKVYECRSAATGLRFHRGLIVCCSFDGLIRCYRAKDFSCDVVYYGAGKNMVMSMDVSGPLIATGNRKGKIEVIKFDKSNLQTCEIRSCNLKFAREDDLVHHLKREHIGLGAKGAMTCPWNQCQMSFSGPNSNKDFEKHLMDHACT